MSRQEEEKGKHGGHRHGFNEPTKAIRIPTALEGKIKEIIDDYRRSKGLTQ